MKFEDKLAQSEQLLRAIFEGALDAVLLVDGKGVYVEVNPAASELYGLPREELIGKRTEDFTEPAFDVRGARRQFLQAGELRGEFRLIRPDGTHREVEFNSRANIVPGMHLTVLRDITARKRTENALRESRYLLEQAQAVAHVGSWVSGVGPDEGLTWSPECYRIFGIREGTPVSVPLFYEHVHPDDREAVRDAVKRATETNVPYEIEHRIRRPDGAVRWLLEKAELSREGEHPYLVGIVQDVTERRRATEELRVSEQRYRRIIETTSEGVWLIDADSNTAFVNTRMAEMLGFTREEMLGRSVFSFMDQERPALVQLSAGEKLRSFSDGRDYRFKRKDGSVLWASLATNPMYDENGRYEGALAMVNDVTERRRAEATRNQFAAIVECSDDAIVSADLDGTIRSWNLGAQKLFGYTAEEAIGQSVLLVVPPERRGEPEANFQRILRGESVDHWETERVRKDGTRVEVSLTLSLLKDAPGRIIGVSVIERDLTERRRAEHQLRKTEERLRQAQKMEAIGSLAGGVAHDFNNLLSVIVSYTSMILEGLRAGDPIRADMEEVMKAGVRAADLTRQLLAFSRKQVLEPRVFDLNETLLGMERMLGRLIGEDVQLTLLPLAPLGKVRADPGQIEQVIMNLAINARDAMPRGGKLTIETANIEIDASQAYEHLEVQAGSYVMLAVSDTGLGMDAATKSRIFEPFFTTKEPGRGTGLGLSTVLGIVQQSGGTIWVYSEPGQGSTFKVYLPRTDAAEQRVSTILTPPATLRGTETILLVEDDDQVRSLTRTILRRNGYTVLEAQNGGEAFLICEQQHSAIHLLLTDIVMPRMSGRKLAERLLALKPDMKVLYMSGYSDGSILHHGVLEPGIAFIQKPITPDALSRKIRAVLDDPAGSALRR